MGTVYITQEDAFLGKTDERITVKANKQQLLDVPLIKVDGIVILGRATGEHLSCAISINA